MYMYLANAHSTKFVSTLDLAEQGGDTPIRAVVRAATGLISES